MKPSDNTTRWFKIGKMTVTSAPSFIAKEAICFGVGCFIQFFNLHTGESHQYSVNLHNQHGDGVKCVRGHRSLNIFAYAENCQEPDLYVLSYPTFEVVFKVTGDASNAEGITHLTFSDTSLLFTLGEMPNNRIVVWNWRRKVKFAESNNKLLYEHQILRCSFGRPMYLAQMAVGANKLVIWDVFTVCTTTLFAQHEVKMNIQNLAPFSDLIWTTDGGFFVIDERASVYTFDRDFNIERVIDCNVVGNNPTSLCWFRNGIAVCGPNKELRHYKKSMATGKWICDNSRSVDKMIRRIICNKTEKMICLTTDNDIYAITNFDSDIMDFVRNESLFDDICVIYPNGEVVLTLCYKKLLNVYEISSGKLISTVNLKNDALVITENSELPYVAVGYENGELQLVSLYNEFKPVIMVTFNLTDNPIEMVKFFEHGRILMAGSLTIGEFFIIEGFPGHQMKVVTSICAQCQIVDYMLVSSEDLYRIFLLKCTSTKYLAGNQVIRYCIVDGTIVNVKTYDICDVDASESDHKEESDEDLVPEVLYTRLIPTHKQHRDRIFYAVPFGLWYLHILQTKRGDNMMRKTKEIRTGHLMRHFDVHISTYYAVTWGYDGLVIVTDRDFENDVGVSSAHHRYLGGVKKAYIDPLGKTTIALGHDGVLAATNLEKTKIDQERKDYLHTLMASDKMALLFTRQTLGYIPEPRFHDKCWKEIQNILKTEREQQICKAERTKILKEFLEIKMVVQDLVTKNLEGPENERIDLLEFYLDSQHYNKMQMDNREECKRTEVYLKALIAAQDKVSKYMIETYWNTMGVRWEVLMGIFTDQCATNYCLLPVDEAKLKRLAWTEEQRKVEMFIWSNDSFQPWVVIDEEKLLKKLSKSPTLPKEDYTGANALRKIRDREETEVNQSEDTKIALNGSVATLYIPLHPGHYKQRELVTFFQCNVQQAVAEHEVIKLKQEANKVFQETRKVKEREMYNIKEKHARLRHIISEYNYFSDRKIDINIVDPVWIQEENPSLIIQVSDDELAITPYVSPSEQAILDAKAAEAERIRLLLLADDFRERALMAMMNGVLEVKWEDELKMEVPKPKCMLEKEPEEFNEEDIRAVHDYEDKVAALNTEREKYKTLLEAEFTRLSINLRDSIRKFNGKIWECTRFKMHIDSGMNHENLQVNRNRKVQAKRIDLHEREQLLLENIRKYEVLLIKQHDTISDIQKAMVECKNNLDNMQVKEKILDKAFKRDFQEMSPVVQEVGVKLYKKRPKVHFRSITTSTVLHTLAKAVVSGEKSISMTAECIDYLKSLEQLDLFIGLPPTIDEATYALICKHRRLRIEYEIRLRAGQVQIQDGENTTATFQKRDSTCKEIIADLNKQVTENRETRLKLLLNSQTQIVLRRGLVEVPLTGSLDDFVDSILVPKKEIEEVNKFISAAGSKKIKVIQQNMAFRRQVMTAEWEHKKLRMQINDLIEQKTDIENVMFTRDMQNFLKNKALGRKTDSDSYEWELELIGASYGKRIKEKKDKLRKLQIQNHNYTKHNEQLDKEIKEINIDLCSYKLQKDYELEKKEPEVMQSRMNSMLKRSFLVQQIQQNYNEILILQTELELLRLRTFPTFKYKLIDE